jgi:hypothetical protein
MVGADDRHTEVLQRLLTDGVLPPHRRGPSMCEMTLAAIADA